MKLQLALDTLTLSESTELLDELQQYLDIIEVGTPFIIEEGMVPVRLFKKRYPEVLILADVKIMDAGEYEAEKCFIAGADIVTVLGVSHDETIKGAVKAAKKYQGQIMVDMIACENLEKRAREIDEFGVDYLCVHTAFDVQGSGIDPLAEMSTVSKGVSKAKLAVAGGLKADNIKAAIAAGAEVIIVGGGITNANDKVAACKKIRELMEDE